MNKLLAMLCLSLVLLDAAVVIILGTTGLLTRMFLALALMASLARIEQLEAAKDAK